MWEQSGDVSAYGTMLPYMQRDSFVLLRLPLCLWYMCVVLLYRLLVGL